METQTLYRGRLIDHVQLVVRDIATSRRFYDAVMAALGVPLGGSADEHFWYDELFVSLPDGPEAQRSEEHTSELQSLMRISYAVFCLKQKKIKMNIWMHLDHYVTTNRQTNKPK